MCTTSLKVVAVGIAFIVVACVLVAGAALLTYVGCVMKKQGKSLCSCGDDQEKAEEEGKPQENGEQ